MGMQASMTMPRAAGMLMIFSGVAQVAQAVLSNRKQSCNATIAPSGTFVPEAGGHGSIAVNVPPTCFWQAQSDAEWLQLTPPGPMLGPGVVQFTSLPAPAGSVRTAVVTLSGVAGSKLKGDSSVAVKQGR